MLGASGTTERSGEIYLPYIGHLSDHIVLLEDGSIMTIARIDGVAFELEETEMRNARCRAFNTLLRNIADDHVSIYAHLVRHADVPSSAPRHFRSVFAASLNEAFEQRVLSGQLLRNEHFLTLIVYPQAALGKVKRRFTKLSGKRENDLTGQIRNMEDLWHVVAGSLKAYGLHRLGIREKQGVLFTEIGEALRLIMTGRFTPVPVVSGSLGASIYTDRVICGKRGLEIRTPKDSYVGSIYSFREYPAKTRPGMLNALLSLDFPLVLTQSFSFLTRPQAHAKLSLKSSQMLSSGDKAVTQIGKLSEAEDALASNEFVMGSHHLSLCVYADDLNSLGDRGARARTRMADAGAVVVQEGIGMEAAYWSQLPGNFKWRTRPGAITSRNFAGFVSFENFPEGASSGHWGNAIARFRTNGGTPFDYIPHEHDVGMTAIFGPIGRGKTTLMMFVLAMLEQSMVDRAGTVVFFDKDRGGELLVRATGGTYLALRRGTPSGLAPLRGLENTAASHDFLREWIVALIESDGRGGISPEENRRLVRGIHRQLSFDPQMRSIAGLREFLLHGPAEGAGARLQRWCRGHALGWAFDGEVDEVKLDPSITGFDMTHLLEYEEVCAPAAAYLLHRIGAMIDGRRFVMSCDEFRAYLLNPKFSTVVDKFLLTVRKNNGMLILATQQPEHVLESPLGASLVAQCMTKIFYPSPTADRSAYVDGLKCTEKEFQAIREDMTVGSRKFLLKRESGSVICEFDLRDMREYVAVLSGRANTVRFATRLREAQEGNSSGWLSEFMARHHEAED
ncbi:MULTISPECIES: VirB4 family type IV secretion/conjugal transfer ATPase [Agrobacterium]|uniref:VirB4 family type IV secretion/conjugal transfer ATPase n=2 Tax=Agrobacterium tumefaciens complex TaxID=1183400 RepID=A0AAE6BK03_AGRTU|nr:MULTISPECIES: VirB4 family type IV secretion/conjugal transfer ATPase [Agrobacterium]ASK40692.1 type IV secretion system protein VirB4 [Agrobacterium genomosp. 6]ASK40888.1 type IV secretion system protein VirB4 [Agrobacterium genomosp. 6]ASK41455.1 type IV secretion system protein VirB4 [Agrobacterium genomosp. 6]QCL77504.1 VirB4 family type IV secretion/conjugal transfer ATPase [Agrobacterium tumefaciens]QCL82992.1 VirB4 family type IV secretion/conjugal transfer ATPase [Agrobacterium tum